MEPAVTEQPKWIQARKYAEQSGYTVSAIKAKRYEGVWREGVEWIRAPDGHIMVNPRAIDQWVESNPVFH